MVSCGKVLRSAEQTGPGPSCGEVRDAMKRRTATGGLLLTLLLWVAVAFASPFTFEDVVQALKDFREGKANISYVQERIAGYLGLTEDIPFKARMNRFVRITPERGLKTSWYLQLWAEEDDSRIESIMVAVDRQGVSSQAVPMVYDAGEKQWTLPEEPSWNTLPEAVSLYFTVTLKNGDVKTADWEGIELAGLGAVEELVHSRLDRVVLTRNGNRIAPDARDPSLLVLDPFAKNVFELDWSGLLQDGDLTHVGQWGYFTEMIRDERGLYATQFRPLDSNIFDPDELFGWKNRFLQRTGMRVRFDVADELLPPLPGNFSVALRLGFDLLPDVVVRPRVEMRRYYESNGKGDAFTDVAETKRLRADFYVMKGASPLNRLRATLGRDASLFVIDQNPPKERPLDQWMTDDYGDAIAAAYRLRDVFPSAVEGAQPLKIEITYDGGQVVSLQTRTISSEVDATMDAGRFPEAPKWYALFEESESEIVSPSFGTNVPKAFRMEWNDTDANRKRTHSEGGVWMSDVFGDTVVDTYRSFRDPTVAEITVPLEDQAMDAAFGGDTGIYFTYPGIQLYAVGKTIFPSPDPHISAVLNVHRNINNTRAGGDYFQIYALAEVRYPSWSLKAYRMPDLRATNVPVRINGTQVTLRNDGGFWNSGEGFQVGRNIADILWPGRLIDGWQANVTFEEADAMLKQDWTFEISYTDTEGEFNRTVRLPFAGLEKILPSVTWYTEDGALADADALWNGATLLGVEVPYAWREPGKARRGQFDVTWRYSDGTSRGNWSEFKQKDEGRYSAGPALTREFEIPDGIEELWAGAGMSVRTPSSTASPSMWYSENRGFIAARPFLDARILLLEDKARVEHATLAGHPDVLGALNFEGAVLHGPWETPVPVRVNYRDNQGARMYIGFIPLEGEWPLFTMPVSRIVGMELRDGTGRTIAIFEREIPAEPQAEARFRTGSEFVDVAPGGLIPANADAVQLRAEGETDGLAARVDLLYIGNDGSQRWRYEYGTFSGESLLLPFPVQWEGCELMGLAVLLEKPSLSKELGQWGRDVPPVVMPHLTVEIDGADFRPHAMNLFAPLGTVAEGDSVRVDLSWVGEVNATARRPWISRGVFRADLEPNAGAWWDRLGAKPTLGKSVRFTIDGKQGVYNLPETDRDRDFITLYEKSGTVWNKVETLGAATEYKVVVAAPFEGADMNIGYLYNGEYTGITVPMSPEDGGRAGTFDVPAGVIEFLDANAWIEPVSYHRQWRRAGGASLGATAAPVPRTPQPVPVGPRPLGAALAAPVRSSDGSGR